MLSAVWTTKTLLYFFFLLCWNPPLLFSFFYFDFSTSPLSLWFLKRIFTFLISTSFGQKCRGKLHFTTLNYPLDYTLHSKLSDCTLCTLNYHTYHALHPGVIFTVIFNRILLHVTSTCFLLRWNKVKRLKHPSSKLIKTKLKFFYISLYLTWGHPLHLHYLY